MINLTQSALALAEGFGLAFSPCILPILPLILASSATGNRWRPLEIVTGFILSFTAFSLVSRQILAATGIQQDQIQFGAFVLLLAFGLVMLLPRLEEKFAALTGGLAERANAASNRNIATRPGGGLLVGALIGVVWTPCAGPILAVALLQVIQSQTNLEAVTTISAFSIGAGLPMLIVGFFGQSLIRYIRALSRHAVTIRRAMGVVIVVFAVMGLSGFNLGEWVVTTASATQSTMESPSKLQDGLDRPYAAPEISGITHWLNSAPLDKDALKGKVVLIDFWTYSCINCIRTLPHIKAWHEKYKDQGLIIIGVHAPEFAFEGKRENVEKAIQKFGITYPVAMDNDFSTWKNYQNRYWPAHYLIDRTGQVVYTHFGEGQYEVTEANIRQLLGLKDATQVTIEKDDLVAARQTPETYLGTERSEHESTVNTEKLPLHYWALQGQWLRTGEYIQSQTKNAALTLHYRAKKVFLVMESQDQTPRTVLIKQKNGEKRLTVDDSKLYEIALNPAQENNQVSIIAENPGLRMFVFTFES
jgi:cytochrome c biogenesis protein CcdA/thiol-disulfide isomerase/thioredoxin